MSLKVCVVVVGAATASPPKQTLIVSQHVQTSSRACVCAEGQAHAGLTLTQQPVLQGGRQAAA